MNTKYDIHRADTRGHSNLGWLDSHHTFSFGQYYDHNRVNFGVLRVLNDDIVQGGYGFDMHPHSNMEIVTIPLSGALEHRDSTGRHRVIKSGEVQIMSAGKGILHSEYNADKKNAVNFLQIWIMPEKQDIQPKYDQRVFKFKNHHNSFLNIVAPDNPDCLQINQQAWIYLGNFDKGLAKYAVTNKKKNGVYIFIIDGGVKIGNILLKKRDGIALSEILTKTLELGIETSSKILLIEIPIRV